LYSAIFVRFFQDGFTSAQFTFYILHISFQFSIFLLDFFLSSIFFATNITNNITFQPRIAYPSRADLGF